MAFFQNKNTSTSLFPPPVIPSAGVDSFNLEIDSTWSKLIGALGYTKHEQRKRALQELIYIVYYLNQKSFKNFPTTTVYVKCPHYYLYDKYFKYLIKKDAVTGVPINDAGDKLFDNDTSRNPLLLSGDAGFPVAISRTNYYLPALETEANVINNIKNALITPASTTLGFISEACTVFAYFYLIRKFSKLNAYKFNHTAQLYSNYATSPPNYFGNIGSNADIQAEISKADANLPYSFLFIRDTLESNLFKTSSAANKTTYLIELVKLFKPLSYLGVSINTDPLYLATTADSVEFLQNIYNLMSSGNRISGSIKFYDDPALSSLISGKEAYIKAKTKTIYEAIDAVISTIISKESKFLYKSTVEDSEIIPESIILATGIGNTTAGLIGLQNLGVNLFSYKLSTTSQPLKTRLSNPILLYRNNIPIIHIVPIGLDHPNTTSASSSLKIINSNNAQENYPFSFNAANPLTALPPFGYANSYKGVDHGTTFDYFLQKSGSPDLDMAKYDKQDLDIKFNNYSNIIYSTYGLSNNLNIQIEIKSEDDGLLVEELQVIVNFIKPEEITAVLSDNLLFGNDKFELNDQKIDALFTGQNTFRDRIKNLLANNQATFRVPILQGGFVGKEKPTTSSVTSRIEVDTNYIPVTGHFPAETSSTPAALVSLYNRIRYSFTKVDLIQTGINSYEIQITIVSFVNPLISRLDNELLLPYNNKSIQLADLNSRFTIAGYTVTGTIPSYNQALAMLRSFGVLEGVCYNILNASSNNATVKSLLSAMLSNISTQSADNTFNSGNASYLITNNIKYNDYKNFKWYNNLADENAYFFKNTPF